MNTLFFIGVGFAFLWFLIGLVVGSNTGLPKQQFGWLLAVLWLILVISKATGSRRPLAGAKAHQLVAP